MKAERDTSRVESGSLGDLAYRIDHQQPSGMASLLARPVAARVLLDVDDPLEGCDARCRSITYGRVGDPAGTHTREQMQAVTKRTFGYLPEYVNVSSEAAEAPGGAGVDPDPEWA